MAPPVSDGRESCDVDTYDDESVNLDSGGAGARWTFSSSAVTELALFTCADQGRIKTLPG